MSDWWYAKGNSKVGPISEEELKRLLERRELNKETRVWKDGMAAWEPLSSIEGLEPVAPIEPPPLPVYTVDPKKVRWRRFFARTFDLLIISSVLSVIVFAIIYRAWEKLALSPTSMIFIQLGMLLVALVVDAIIAGLFTTTLGKLILGLRVEKDDGKPLTFVNFFDRNIYMWGSAYAFGIPPIAFFTLIYQYNKVGKTGQATYDAGRNYKVVARPLTIFRVIIFSVLFIAIMWLNTGIGVIAQESLHKRFTSAPTQAEIEWLQQQKMKDQVENRAPAVAPDETQEVECSEIFYEGKAPTTTNERLLVKSKDLCMNGFVIHHSGVSRTALWAAEHLTSESIHLATTYSGSRPLNHNEPKLTFEEGTQIYDFMEFKAVRIVPTGDMHTSASIYDTASTANLLAVNSFIPLGELTQIENIIRMRTSAAGESYVFTGPLLMGEKVRRVNGRVLVPTHIFKAAYFPATKETLAWVMELEGDGVASVNMQQKRGRMVSLEELEQMSGYNFFPSVSKDIKRQIAQH